jgi:hypothetical protein
MATWQIHHNKDWNQPIGFEGGCMIMATWLIHHNKDWNINCSNSALSQIHHNKDWNNGKRGFFWELGNKQMNTSYHRYDKSITTRIEITFRQNSTKSLFKRLIHHNKDWNYVPTKQHKVTVQKANPSQQGLKHTSDCDSRQFMEHPS